jgi:hypothetical protein
MTTMASRKPPKNVVEFNPLTYADPHTAVQSSTVVVSPPESEPVVDTPAHSEAPPAERPVPESELTPEQLRIRHLEDQLAREMGKKDPAVEYEPPTDSGENILIHFLEDGMTANGQVWYRGQELEFVPGSQTYRDTFDRNGNSWLDLRNNEFAQVDKYKKIMFRSGPWPGRSIVDAAGLIKPLKSLNGDQAVPPPTTQELEAAAAAEAKRRRAAPRLPTR